MRSCADCQKSIDHRGANAQRCEECAKARIREYGKSPKISAYQKRYRETARARRLNPEKHLPKPRVCADCPENIDNLYHNAKRCQPCAKARARKRSNANSRKWAKANPEKVAEKRRKWRKANPEKVKAHAKRYRDKARAELDPKCVECGNPLEQRQHRRCKECQHRRNNPRQYQNCVECGGPLPPKRIKYCNACDPWQKSEWIPSSCRGCGQPNPKPRRVWCSYQCWYDHDMKPRSREKYREEHPREDIPCAICQTLIPRNHQTTCSDECARIAQAARPDGLRKHIPYLINRDGAICGPHGGGCGDFLPYEYDDGELVHVDHIHPVSKEDTYPGEDIHHPDNLQLMHAPCNMAKGDRTP